MGLFGPKKEKPIPKVSDIFSDQDLKKISKIIGPKQAKKMYGKYSSMAETLLEVAKNPNREYSKKEWFGIFHAAGGFTRLEPELAPMLRGAIGKYRKFK